jgi:hypothetical protein
LPSGLRVKEEWIEAMIVKLIGLFFGLVARSNYDVARSDGYSRRLQWPYFAARRRFSLNH